MRWWKKESQGTKDAKERLESVRKDDEVVDSLARRAKKILKENNLAPDIMKALGMHK